MNSEMGVGWGKRFSSELYFLKGKGIVVIGDYPLPPS